MPKKVMLRKVRRFLKVPLEKANAQLLHLGRTPFPPDLLRTLLADPDGTTYRLDFWDKRYGEPLLEPLEGRDGWMVLDGHNAVHFV